MPYAPAPTRGAVRAAETGIRPEKSVARSAPMRWIPLYQQTKPMTVTTAACQSNAVVSPGVGIRRNPPPSSRTPRSAASSAAMQQTVADSSFGPSGRSTGTASTANPTSPASAPTENRIPARSVRPQPWTVKAPAATSPAAYRTARDGRRPSSTGTRTPTTMGAQPTRTPGIAGSADCPAASTARLNPTMPTAARRVSLPHWRRVRVRSGARPERPFRRSSGTSRSAARP